MLTIHATIEAEIFYPAARAAKVDADLLDEAEVEHASCKELITQIRSMNVDDELYDATVTVLNEYIYHHVKEEQDEIFPKCRKSSIDLDVIGSELSDRKDALMAASPKGRSLVDFVGPKLRAFELAALESFDGFGIFVQAASGLRELVFLCTHLPKLKILEIL